ncbi:MAG: hypothetical protein N6V49_00145 [Serratia symbiotica]|nr:hypothetical protein [Serratia symbiotica]
MFDAETARRVWKLTVAATQSQKPEIRRKVQGLCTTLTTRSMGFLIHTFRCWVASRLFGHQPLRPVACCVFE